MPSTVKIHLGVRRGKEKKVQNRTNSRRKKAQQRNISHMWGKAPANDTATKFGTGVKDVITHAKF